MMRNTLQRALPIMLALALVASVGLVTATPVAAEDGPTTRYVATDGNDGNDGTQGSPWLSIQYAVDQASAGDTIVVAAGTYEEAITIPEELTGLQLLGAQAGVDARGEMDDGWYQGRSVADESVIDADGGSIAIQDTEGVVIDGFTIQNVDRIMPNGDNNTLRNNIIVGDAGGIGVIWAPWSAAKKASGLPHSNLTIEKNWIKDTQDSGVYHEDGPNVGFMIVDNLFTDMGHSGVILTGKAYTDTVVSRNQMLNVGASHGINLGGTSQTGLVVEDNIIENLTGTATRSGLQIRAPEFVDSTIQNNMIVGAPIGLQFHGNVVTADLDVTIENNTFENNAIQVMDLIGDVNLEPILADNTFDRAVVVRGSGIKVPTIFSSIQDAIDAAEADDIIEVAAGTYEENIEVNVENLTLRSTELHAAIIDGGGDGTVVKITADGVIVEGFTVQNAGMRGNNSDAIAAGTGMLIHESSDCLIENNLVKDNSIGIAIMAEDAEATGNTIRGNEIRDNVYKVDNTVHMESDDDATDGAGGVVYGQGIRIRCRSDNPAYAAGTFIDNNIISGSKDGLKFSRPSGVKVEDNVIYENYHRGIHLYAVDDSTFTGNEIYNNGIDGLLVDEEDYEATQGARNSAGVRLTANSKNNTFTNNSVYNEHDTGGVQVKGFRLFGSGTTGNVINFNNIYGHDEGYETHQYGIDTREEPPDPAVDATNNWWGHDSGPYRDDTNADGLGNRVSDNVIFDPWLGELYEPVKTADTDTDTGEIVCSTCTGAVEALGTKSVEDLSPEALDAMPEDFVFPHGLFSFNIVGLEDGAEVTVSITLPERADPNMQYWKYYDDAWHQIPMIIDSQDDEVIHITLVDGGLGDADGTVDGTIVDPGGPVILQAPAPAPVSFPSAVGGEAYAANKLALLAPWLGVLSLILMGGVLVLRRRSLIG